MRSETSAFSISFNTLCKPHRKASGTRLCLLVIYPHLREPQMHKTILKSYFLHSKCRSWTVSDPKINYIRTIRFFDFLIFIDLILQRNLKLPDRRTMEPNQNKCFDGFDKSYLPNNRQKEIVTVKSSGDMSKKYKKLRSGLQEYGNCASFHGLRFVTDPHANKPRR